MEEQITVAEQSGQTQISTTDPDARKLTKSYTTTVGVN